MQILHCGDGAECTSPCEVGEEPNGVRSASFDADAMKVRSAESTYTRRVWRRPQGRAPRMFEGRSRQPDEPSPLEGGLPTGDALTEDGLHRLGEDLSVARDSQGSMDPRRARHGLVLGCVWVDELS